MLLVYFAETLNKYGADSYIGRVSSIIMGSTETIFYTLTVYFGAIGVKKIRHTLWVAMFSRYNMYDYGDYSCKIYVLMFILNYDK